MPSKFAFHLFCLVVFLCCNRLYSQENNSTTDNANQQLLEILSEQSDAAFDFDTYLENLSDLKQNPLDINHATTDDFIASGIFNADQTSNIINYRERMNGFSTLYELQNVEGFDYEFLKLILPYIQALSYEKSYPKTPFKKIFFSGKYQTFLRYTQIIERQEGYTITDTSRQRYLGSPQRFYLRFRYNYSNKFSYGITAEKDPGEQFFKGNQKQGFDYYSAHIFIRDVGIFKSIALGDYNVRLGQGLAMWTGFGFRKTPIVNNIQKFSQPLSAYTSVNEANYLRGFASTIGIKKLDITTFISYRNLDANIVEPDSANNDFEAVSSIQETGLHRTPNEFADKNAIKLFTTGGSIKYRFKNTSVAFNAVHNRLNATLQTDNELYRLYAFSGNSVSNFSIDYNYVFNNISLFGEAAMNTQKGFALLNGALINTGSIIDIALLHRYYDKRYFAQQSLAFGEASTATNEQGFYAGFNIRLFKGVNINTYADFFRFPWLRYLVDAPSSGFDYFGQLNIKPAKSVEMYFRYRYEIKQANSSDNETKIDFLTNVIRQNIRYHVSYTINDKISLQNRFEYVWFNDGINKVEKGFMIYQDVKLTPFKFPLTIYARYTLFDTESYNTRLYAYENDILFSFSIPPLFETGFRYYIMLNYAINKNVSLWLRFAQTQLNDAKTIGSGLDEIQGNSRSEIKTQVRITF